MCDETCKCQHPKRLKRKVEECTPEQIKECHGDAPAHPCAAGEQTPEKTDKA